MKIKPFTVKQHIDTGKRLDNLERQLRLAVNQVCLYYSHTEVSKTADELVNNIKLLRSQLGDRVSAENPLAGDAIHRIYHPLFGEYSPDEQQAEQISKKLTEADQADMRLNNTGKCLDGELIEAMRRHTLGTVYKALRLALLVSWI